MQIIDVQFDMQKLNLIFGNRTTTPKRLSPKEAIKWILLRDADAQNKEFLDTSSNPNLDIQQLFNDQEREKQKRCKLLMDTYFKGTKIYK